MMVMQGKAKLGGLEMARTLGHETLERYHVAPSNERVTGVTVAASGPSEAREVALRHWRESIPGFTDLGLEVTELSTPDLDEAHEWAIANDDTLARTYRPV